MRVCRRSSSGTRCVPDESSTTFVRRVCVESCRRMLRAPPRRCDSASKRAPSTLRRGGGAAARSGAEPRRGSALRPSGALAPQEGRRDGRARFRLIGQAHVFRHCGRRGPGETVGGARVGGSPVQPSAPRAAHRGAGSAPIESTPCTCADGGARYVSGRAGCAGSPLPSPKKGAGTWEEAPPLFGGGAPGRGGGRCPPPARQIENIAAVEARGAGGDRHPISGPAGQ